jgi:hypothetical protein
MFLFISTNTSAKILHMKFFGAACAPLKVSDKSKLCLVLFVLQFGQICVRRQAVDYSRFYLRDGLFSPPWMV